MYTWTWAWNHFSFTIALIVGAVLVGYNLPRRRRFLLRAVVCLCALIGFGFTWEWFYYFIAQLDIGRWYWYIGLIKFFLQYIMVTFSMWRCFDCNFFAALFCSTAAYCMEHISQRTYQILARFALVDVSFAVNMLIRTVITAAIYAFIYFMAIRKNKASLSSIVVDNKIQILSSAIVISAVIVLGSLVGRPSTDVDLSRTAINLLTISSAFLALMLEFNVLLSKKRQKAVDELQHMLSEKSEQYKIEKTNIEQINIKLHDLRHQIATLDDKIDKEELREIADTIDIYNCFIETGNEAIDTVITQKSFYCQKHKIRLSCLLDGKIINYIPSHELYAMFGNAIENAIGAVEKLDIEKRIISIVESRHSGFVTIRITNYFDENINFIEGLPVTKKNRDYHGFGMKSMKLIAEKHGGKIDVQTRGDLFILAICLPINGCSHL